jgi:hypothetical protein
MKIEKISTIIIIPTTLAKGFESVELSISFHFYLLS